ncbi:protein of unknown function [Pseudorhizobium banfieldiae]|uniref:Uncharacterized protein n=1 Tax=Pseudorhizobium banfieldiae TaxID=1125847 RepID=L0NIR4_9HYPH|nr:protein of unknown function [Pseudorhizobium banfieldiae]
MKILRKRFVVPDETLLSCLGHGFGVFEPFMRACGATDDALERGTNLVCVAFDDVTCLAFGEYFLAGCSVLGKTLTGHRDHEARRPNHYRKLHSTSSRRSSFSCSGALRSDALYTRRKVDLRLSEST